MHAGAWDVDKHFRDAPFEKNIPVQLGLSSIWNVSFLGYAARAILPYTQALSKLAPHIQQVIANLHHTAQLLHLFCLMFVGVALHGCSQHAFNCMVTYSRLKIC